jgi:histone acetyltransferase (RNA polymerase elongator complex component)
MAKFRRIYPVFLSHAGCPFRCVYCNQLFLTRGDGHDVACLSPAEQLAARTGEAQRQGFPGEVAFYGGTFTAMPAAAMTALLEEASRAVEQKIFTGIRFSTRPDCLEEMLCVRLGAFPITTVELGVQSFSGEVLDRSRRGYGPDSAALACRRVVENGWRLGIQLMPGLPGDSLERFLGSVHRAIELKPGFVRLYPTLILEGTELARWHRAGHYEPLTLAEAVRWCVPAYDALRAAGIGVARLGVHGDVAGPPARHLPIGPYHPAFGYLVRSAWWRRQVDRELESGRLPGGLRRVLLRVPPAAVGEVVGDGRANIRHWKVRWGWEVVRVRGDAAMAGGGCRCDALLKVVPRSRRSRGNRDSTAGFAGNAR